MILSEAKSVIAAALIATDVFPLIVFKSSAVLVSASPAAITIVYACVPVSVFSSLTVSVVSIEAVTSPPVAASSRFALSTLIVPLLTFKS